MAVVLKHVSDPLPRPRQFVPDLPEAVERILFKALAKDPADRYPSMAEMKAAMERALARGMAHGEDREAERQYPSARIEAAPELPPAEDAATIDQGVEGETATPRPIHDTADAEASSRPRLADEKRAAARPLLRLSTVKAILSVASLIVLLSVGGLLVRTSVLQGLGKSIEATPTFTATLARIPTSTLTPTLTLTPTFTPTPTLKPTATPELSSPPEIVGKDKAESILRSGVDFLEGEAREKPSAEDLAKPGTFTYTVPITDPSKPVVWAYGWCAKDKTTLDDNFKHIELAFDLDGKAVGADRLATIGYQTRAGFFCRLVYTVLKDWPAGEHHLSIKATFDQTINDGQDDYPAGDYVLVYNVYVKP